MSTVGVPAPPGFAGTVLSASAHNVIVVLAVVAVAAYVCVRVLTGARLADVAVAAPRRIVGVPALGFLLEDTAAYTRAHMSHLLRTCTATRTHTLTHARIHAALGGTALDVDASGALVLQFQVRLFRGAVCELPIRISWGACIGTHMCMHTHAHSDPHVHARAVSRALQAMLAPGSTRELVSEGPAGAVGAGCEFMQPTDAAAHTHTHTHARTPLRGGESTDGDTALEAPVRPEHVIDSSMHCVPSESAAHPSRHVHALASSRVTAHIHAHTHTHARTHMHARGGADTAAAVVEAAGARDDADPPSMTLSDVADASDAVLVHACDHTHTHTHTHATITATARVPEPCVAWLRAAASRPSLLGTRFLAHVLVRTRDCACTAAGASSSVAVLAVMPTAVPGGGATCATPSPDADAAQDASANGPLKAVRVDAGTHHEGHEASSDGDSVLVDGHEDGETAVQAERVVDADAGALVATRITSRFMIITESATLTVGDIFVPGQGGSLRGLRSGPNGTAEELPVQAADDSCVVCMGERAAVVMQPCMHVCVCANCITHIQSCPICRARIQSHVVLRPTT